MAPRSSDSGPAVSRPVHLHPGFLALVFLGGAVGAACREALSLAFPDVDGVPVALFGINLLGAFLLGVLLEGLARRGPDVGRRRVVRLTLGTGVLGGFTSYSSLATGVVLLLQDGRWGIGVGYAVATVLLGGLMTWAGMAVSALVRRPSVDPTENGGRP